MAGDASEATAAFGRAKVLFGAGQYHDAMRLLVDLDRKYPNTRNILLAMAACLEKIDCLGEAEQICDRLLANGPDPRAAEIKARIHAARAVSGDIPPIPNMPNADVPDVNMPDAGGLYAPIDLDAPRPRAPQPPPSTEGMSRQRMIIIGAVIGAVVLLLAVPMILGGGRQAAAPAAQHAQTTTVQQPEGGAPPQRGLLPPMSGPGAWVLSMLISYGFSVVVFYPMLRYTGRLREGSAVENLQDLALTMFYAYLWGLIPILGGILGVMHIMRHYEISCLEMLVMCLIATVLQVAVWVLVVMPLLAGMAMVATGAAVH